MDKTILCIDDGPQVLLLYTRIFEDQGYKVVLASSGRDGLDAMRRHPIDCVILDYEMPGMDGAGVVQRMADLEAAPPVILVSGSGPPQDLRARVDAFLEKPTRIAQLLGCVDEVIGAAETKSDEPACFVSETLGSIGANHNSARLWVDCL